MTYLDAINILKENKLEISDIKDILKYIFYFDYNLIAIDGNNNIDIKKFNTILKKIKKGYPIQYITSNMEIRGLKLVVNKDVLIPRSETIEFIYNYLKNNYNFNNSSILDLCSGSGIISLLIKKEYPESKVIGSDISTKALKISKLNALNNNLEITYVKSNYFKNINNKYDYIISNPPYVPYSKKTKELKYEPKISLFATNNGLSEYEKIFIDIDKFLNNNGSIFIELEETNAEQIKKLFLKYNPKYEISIYFDLNKKPRYLIGKKYE